MHLVFCDIFDGDRPVESRICYGQTQAEAEERFSRACARDPMLAAVCNGWEFEGQRLRFEGRHIEIPDDQVPAMQQQIRQAEG